MRRRPFARCGPNSGRPLDPQTEASLDAYLEDKFRGRFTMAGIRFWPEMRPLPAELEQRRAREGDPVVVFTNVVFDTSQVHANHSYGSMFEWLDDVGRAIRAHPERWFVLRAHPDETRPGKASRQNVQAWVEANGLEALPNVVFLPPEAGVSSYELIRRAFLVLVYNSSIGLEAAIAGKRVLCAGRARYSEAGAVFTAHSPEEYRRRLEEFLADGGRAATSAQVEAGRRFLDFELNRASLDFSRFLADRPGRPGMVRLRRFEASDLARAAKSQVVVRGLLDGQPFLLESGDRPKDLGVPDGIIHAPTGRISCMKFDYRETPNDLLTRIDLHQRYGAHDIDAWMLDLLRPSPGSRILDVGCGAGKQCFLFDQHLGGRATIVGGDVSPELLARARQENDGRGGRIEFRDLDFNRRFPWEAGTFDLVSCCFAIYYAENIEHTIGEMARVLAPGGRLFTTGPMPENKLFFYEVIAEATGRPIPRMPGSSRYASEILEAVRGRFERVEVHVFENPLTFDRVEPFLAYTRASLSEDRKLWGDFFRGGDDFEQVLSAIERTAAARLQADGSLVMTKVVGGFIAHVGGGGSTA